MLLISNLIACCCKKDALERRVRKEGYDGVVVWIRFSSVDVMDETQFSDLIIKNSVYKNMILLVTLEMDSISLLTVCVFEMKMRTLCAVNCCLLMVD